MRARFSSKAFFFLCAGAQRRAAGGGAEAEYTRTSPRRLGRERTRGESRGRAALAAPGPAAARAALLS